MAPTPDAPGVFLARDDAASTILHRVLCELVDAFPDALAGVGLPEDPRAFRGAYPEALPRLEAARAASPRRAEIARVAAAATRRALVWRDGDGERPLAEALTEPAEPLPLETSSPDAVPGWRASVVWKGERHEGAALADLGGRLRRSHLITPAAGRTLGDLEADVLADGVLDLSDRRIVVLGAGAEMAPTRLWLEAGAEVLWLDVAPPSAEWLEDVRLAGRLWWPEGGTDLLTRPREVLATIRAFAEAGPVDLGLYAYAPGRARELRLTGAMNAIVDALAPALVASVTLLVSPTTPTALDAEDRAVSDARRVERPAWEAALARTGLLGRGAGYVRFGDGAATRTVVSIQGASYQAAQYLGKVLAAECWATHGAPDAPTPAPLRVSANTAAITRTRSLDHPVFAAAFGGAGAFGVETFTPPQSRRVNGLLAVADWRRADAPVPGAVRVHGGIHTLPGPLEPALRIAALIGFARSPRLLRGLIRG
jgi:hypothetical protein